MSINCQWQTSRRRLYLLEELRNIAGMDLRDLKYFVAIADQEHFDRVSKQLRIAQPALSRRMKSLEREIGGDLFERLPRGVRLTKLGQFFLKDAKWIAAETSLV